MRTYNTYTHVQKRGKPESSVMSEKSRSELSCMINICMQHRLTSYEANIITIIVPKHGTRRLADVPLKSVATVFLCVFIQIKHDRRKCACVDRVGKAVACSIRESDPRERQYATGKGGVRASRSFRTSDERGSRRDRDPGRGAAGDAHHRN